MFGRAWFMGLFRSQADRATIELEPLDQRILLFLGKFGNCGFRRIATGLNSERAVTEADTVFALTKLERAGLLDRASGAADTGTVGVYCLNRRGRRIARLLPRDLRSRIQFSI